MAVSVGTGGGSSRRKSLDAEINLVPFIDLLSMCICFLLITAVWIQVGSVQVKQSHGTDAAASSPQQLEMDVQFSSPRSLAVQVKKGGKAVKKMAIEASAQEGLSSKFDVALKGMIESLGGNRKDLFASAMITPKSGVPYGDMVSVMDVLRKYQIANLGVVPTRAK